MKLTKRQKKIILISVISFFLALTVIAIAVLLVNKDKEKSSSSVPHKNPPPADLEKIKTETVTLLEQKLSADNIKVENLLQELKNEHALNAGENN